MRQWVELCVVLILVSVVVAKSDNNSNNRKNVCQVAQNFFENNNQLLAAKKDICQCNDLASVEVFDQAGTSIIKYQRCNKCSDNRPPGVVSGFCSKNGNGFWPKLACIAERFLPKCVGETKYSVCCQGSVATTTQGATQPPPTEPPSTTTPAATTTTLCTPDGTVGGPCDDGVFGKK